MSTYVGSISSCVFLQDGIVLQTPSAVQRRAWSSGELIWTQSLARAGGGRPAPLTQTPAGIAALCKDTNGISLVMLRSADGNELWRSNMPAVKGGRCITSFRGDPVIATPTGLHAFSSVTGQEDDSVSVEWVSELVSLGDRLIGAGFSGLWISEEGTLDGRWTEEGHCRNMARHERHLVYARKNGKEWTARVRQASSLEIVFDIPACTLVDSAVVGETLFVRTSDGGLRGVRMSDGTTVLELDGSAHAIQRIAATTKHVFAASFAGGRLATRQFDATGNEGTNSAPAGDTLFAHGDRVAVNGPNLEFHRD